MKTKLYSISFLLVLLFSLLISQPAFTQRHWHGRGYYRHYYPRSYSLFSVHVGGPYARGYYRPYGPYFHLGIPAFGFRVAALPYGSQRFYLGPDPYYYYGGTYYRPYASEYEVVAPPLGASVRDLPPGSKAKIIDGVKYYEMDGTFYRAQFDERNRLSYKVVGTDGVLNTDEDTQDNRASEPRLGDRIERLPANFKTLVINGEKLYSADGLYYKKGSEGGKTYYEVVGK